MNQRKAGTVLAASAALGLAATACAPGRAGAPASAASPAKLTACPQSSAPGGARPSGAPGDGRAGGAVGIPVAKTVTASSTRDSIVIDPAGPQIQCGQAQLTTYRDVTYSTPVTNGKKTTLKLDVQVPKTAGKKPLIIFITGGGFVLADKSANLNQRTYVAEQGYVVASIQYRTTAQGATYKDGVADVKSAIRYLRVHAGQYDINAAKVAVWGQSAGGYLAAMTGTTNGLRQFNTGGNLGQSSTVQAVVDEFGPSDLSKLAADFDTATQKANYAAGNTLAQWVFGPGTRKSILDGPAKVVAAANPITYISATTAPPFAELHGTRDQLVSPSQTELVNNALRARGVASTRYLIKGANHGDLSFTGNTTAARPWSTQKVMGLILSFLRQHLGS